MPRPGRSARLIFGPLLFALITGAAAAASSPLQKAFLEARDATDRGDTLVATKIVEDALKSARSADDDDVWALRVLRAELFIHTGKRDEAAKILDQSFPARLRNRETGVWRLVTLSLLHWYGNRLDQAIRSLDEARPIAASHAPQLVPSVLGLRGAMRGSDADFADAIRIAKERRDPIRMARIEVNLARHYGGTQRYAEAVALDATLRSRLQHPQLRRSRKTHNGNMGWIYLELGDYDQALQRVQEANADAQRMNDLNERLLWLNLLGDLHFVRRDWPNAERAYRQALGVNKQSDHREVAHSLANLARVAIETGRFEEARALVAKALSLESAASDKVDELTARVLSARIDLAARDYKTAEKTLKDVLKAKKLGPITTLEVHHRLAQTYAATKRNDLAVASFDRALGEVQAARKAVASDKELSLPFFNRSTALFDDYVDFLIDNGRVEDALRATEASRAQTLAEGLAAKDQTKLDPRAIAKQSNATILCYWLGRRRSYVWTVTPSNVRVTTLPDDVTIERSVELYRDRILARSNTFETSSARGQALYRMLVAEAARGIALSGRVIIVPDGKLHTLNFETLVVPSKPPRYWIENVVLSNGSSLQLLARKATVAASPRILLVGDPLKADAAFPELKHAAEEIRVIAAQFARRATVLERGRATPADYKAAAPQSYEFLHFAAHGVAARQRPLDSAVILGRGADRTYRLPARDIAQRPLAARLVTISSCDGAGAATYAGEGLVGLAWAFLHAGAQQVVAALWAVSDSAAPRLMEQMYIGIRAGHEPAVALRNAKLKLLRQKTIHRQARYWAPFIIYM